MMALEQFKEKITTYNFPRKLWMLASNKDICSICWAKGGTAIMIDRNSIERECFATGIFNVMKTSHLLRQLCYYNFKRDYTSKEYLLFSHLNFRAGREDLLPFVRRSLKSGRRKNIKNNMRKSVKRKKKLVLLKSREFESNVDDRRSLEDSNNKGSRKDTGASRPERVKSFNKIGKILDVKKTHFNIIMPHERMEYQFAKMKTFIADQEINSQVRDGNLLSVDELEPSGSKSAQYCGEKLEVDSKKSDLHFVGSFRKSSYVYTGPVWLKAENSDKYSSSKLADMDCEEESSSDTEQCPRSIVDILPFEETFNSFSNVMWDGESDEMFIYPLKEKTELRNRIMCQKKKQLIELYKSQLKNGEICISNLLDSENDINNELLYDILTSDIKV